MKLRDFIDPGTPSVRESLFPGLDKDGVEAELQSLTIHMQPIFDKLNAHVEALGLPIKGMGYLYVHIWPDGFLSDIAECIDVWKPEWNLAQKTLMYHTLSMSLTEQAHEYWRGLIAQAAKPRPDGPDPDELLNRLL